MNKIDRNDPCPCRSGKKYKKCCLGKKLPATIPSEGSDGMDLDVKAIFHYISVASEIIGSGWLARKTKEEDRKREKDSLNVDERKHSYLFRTQPHPLVRWSLEVEQWRRACLASGKLELNEAVLRYAVLGRSLEHSKKCKGFEKLISRLKQASAFDSAAFEAEVAASYVVKGWSVEFVEEGSERTPDLKVIRDDRSLFWVECKCRDLLSERDKNIQLFWTELESSLLRVLGPKKCNFFIFVKSLEDPRLTELTNLRNFLFDSVTKGGTGSLDITTGRKQAVSDPSGKFLVTVSKLVEPDEEIKASSIEVQLSDNFDSVKILAEAKINEKGESYFRNPIIIALKNSKLSDKVVGVINAFKSAIGQLPEEGPGVIWIRVPDGAWSRNVDKSFEQAENLIRHELKGSKNQRVNAVILMTRIFQKLEKDNLSGLGYKPLKIVIEHKNPRCPVIQPDTPSGREVFAKTKEE